MTNPARLGLAAVSAAALLAAAPALAVEGVFETEHHAVQVTTLAEGLAHPWGLAFLPEGGMLVTEREGRLRHVAEDGALSEPIAGVPEVDARGQGGLLDVEIDPDFDDNRLVYITYAEPGEDGNSTAIARGTLSDDLTELQDVEVIFTQQPKLPSEQHFGSRLVFDDEGHLFATLGERSDAQFRDQAQDLDSHLGKVIRILPDGSVPEDNPFVGEDGALPEIWSLGHRNPQGAVLHPETGELWIVDHGPRGGDELNVPRAGENHGWPVATYGTEYSGAEIMEGETFPDAFVEPVAYWVPSPAPSGLEYYTGEEFPEWQGGLLFGALAGTALVRVELDGEAVLGDEFMFEELGLRIRDVHQAPDGAVVLLTDEPDGRILRLTNAG